MGQSTTLTGRSIVRHMNAQVNMELTGEYDFCGKSAIYSDTDSCYFSASFMMNENTTREQYIELYDLVADAVNTSFPQFMHDTFNTSMKRGAIIAAGRELVASKMLFIKKKKYGGLIYDLEGKRMDEGNGSGKLKVMGLDLKRSDTPKYMQNFLEETLLDVLTGSQSSEIIKKIKQFRTSFKDRPAWEKGSPKKVNGLSKAKAKLDKAASLGISASRRDSGRVNIAGHARASLNWNTLLDHYNDKFSMRITDGSRIVVCKLLPNVLKMDSIAYPVDEPHLPKWFKDLPFDHATMEEVIIDKKIANLLSVLKWPLENSKIASGDEFFSW